MTTQNSSNHNKNIPYCSIRDKQSINLSLNDTTNSMQSINSNDIPNVHAPELENKYVIIGKIDHGMVLNSDIFNLNTNQTKQNKHITKVDMQLYIKERI